MVRKSKPNYVPISTRCAGNKECERAEFMKATRSGIPLDISADYYPTMRAWLIEEESTLNAQGRTIAAGYVRDNITEHDRRYGWKD